MPECLSMVLSVCQVNLWKHSVWLQGLRRIQLPLFSMIYHFIHLFKFCSAHLYLIGDASGNFNSYETRAHAQACILLRPELRLSPAPISETPAHRIKISLATPQIISWMILMSFGVCGCNGNWLPAIERATCNEFFPLHITEENQYHLDSPVTFCQNKWGPLGPGLNSFCHIPPIWPKVSFTLPSKLWMDWNLRWR